MSSIHTAVPPLPTAWEGDRVDLDTPAGRVSLYCSFPAAVPGSAGSTAQPSQPSQHPPLLLVHSVNAAASAAEVAPLFNHYRTRRPVYALELPGYGFSDRSDRVYSLRLMTDAVHAAVTWVREKSGGGPIDVLAVSLACEFVARVQCEAPGAFRRMAMVSPTGFRGPKLRYGPTGSSLGLPWLHRVLRWRPWREAIFNGLTRPAVVRYFLQRTWGAKVIDEYLWRYCVVTARQPGARHAPLYFVSAFLFSNDVNTLYESLDIPVWVSMATRGDFTDYQGRVTVKSKPNWQFHAVTGGALPYFEDLAAFTRLLDPFWSSGEVNAQRESSPNFPSPFS